MVEKTIEVYKICPYAMFEDDGIALRNMIIEDWNKNADLIFTLDFNGIAMFATMFFNASIGWFVLHKGADETKKRIRYTNLSKLGEETWAHSFSNAVGVANNLEYQQYLSQHDPADEE